MYTSDTDSTSLSSSVLLARRHSVGSNCKSSFKPYKKAKEESKVDES